MTRISTIRSSATIIGVGTGYSNDPVTPILKKYKGRQRYHRQQGCGFPRKRRPFKTIPMLLHKEKLPQLVRVIIW